MGLRTVLYDSHIARGARMVDFGGWDMPVQYDGVLAEHARVRTDVGLFDTAHMDAFWLEGADSLDVLSRLVTQDVRTLAVGGCRYGFLLNEDGGVIDDLIVYRMGERQWMPVVNAGTAPTDFAWVLQQCEGTATAVRDLRDTQAKLDLQGPSALATLRRVFGVDAAGLTRFRWMRVRVGAAEWIISRTGYTGEDGVELYAPHAALFDAWQALLDAGVKPCGLGARDTLRLEAGLPLYGHEFDTATSPAEAGLLRFCAKPEPFIGQEALRRRAAKPEALLVPFRLEGRQTARNGQAVRREGGEPVGRVTSGSFGPTVGQAIGFAYVAPPYACPGTRWFVDNGRMLLPAEVTELPFIRKEAKS
jgi:aminomethyltransferase